MSLRDLGLLVFRVIPKLLGSYTIEPPTLDHVYIFSKKSLVGFGKLLGTAAIVIDAHQITANIHTISQNNSFLIIIR